MSDPSLQRIFDRLYRDLARDTLIQTTTEQLRKSLHADRVVLYYFYYKWSGKVTFESLSDDKFSILGTSGPDECFNGEYAKLYEDGRVRAIADIESEPIQPCHRDFLHQLEVKANLVVPILIDRGLWGLLVAHNCQSTYTWSSDEIMAMQTGAGNLAKIRSIQES
ncbi:GAF domain-containing protein [Chamaesiphon sp. VAR_48_metabat_135_sub]|uniref:GAF domain-containing protein n=1 Tax=Chamaesiphon sp. VAR_48_metabat_135_sub TaxID=2964699 RepID=UPI00286BAA1F|nr:GAF domain-containing protein [Chamaesiphon sp. VAR_48_metabat_135_sub]